MAFKNTLHFLLYQVRHGQIRLVSFCINLLILVMAVAQIKSLLELKSVFLLMLLVFLNIVWQFIGTFSDFASCLRHIPLEESPSAPDFDRVQISSKEKELGFVLLRSGNSGATISRTVNGLLQIGEEPGCRIDPSRSRLVEESIRRYYPTLLLYLKCRLQFAVAGSKAFYNEKKLCLSAELEPNEPVAFHRGCYYNTHVTNKTYFSALFDAEGHEIRSPYFEKYGCCLPDLGTSELSDEIGVSTIGFTQDGYILTLRQNIRANASPGLLVPTGSGSADWADYRPQGFYDTVCAATNRELFEEIGKPKPLCADTAAKTKVIGFYRWINYGGKPEFVSISRLNVGVHRIFPEKDEQMPTISSQYVFSAKTKEVDYKALDRFLSEAMAGSRCSFPLYVNAHVLREFISGDKEAFEVFLFS